MPVAQRAGSRGGAPPARAQLTFFCFISELHFQPPIQYFVLTLVPVSVIWFRINLAFAEMGSIPQCWPFKTALEIVEQVWYWPGRRTSMWSLLLSP